MKHFDNLNPHSSLASFYRHYYLKSELPNNLCAYFWLLLFAFIMLPFFWISLVINRLTGAVKKTTTTRGIYEDITDEKGYTRNKWVGEQPYSYYYVTPSVSTFYGIIFTFFTLILGAFIDSKFIHVVHASTPYLAVLYTYLVGVASLIFIALLIYLIVIFIKYLLSKRKPLTLREIADKEKAKEDAKYAEWENDNKRRRYRRENPSFLRLAWNRLVAFKENNCPMLTWNYDEPTNKDKDERN